MVAHRRGRRQNEAIADEVRAQLLDVEADINMQALHPIYAVALQYKAERCQVSSGRMG